MEEKPERKKKKSEETSKEPNAESKSKLLLALKEEVIKLKKLERIDTEEIEKLNAKLKQEIEEREKLSLWVKEKLRPGLATFKEEVRSEISTFKSESQKAQNPNNSGVSKEEFLQMMKEMKVLKDQIESMNQEMVKLKNINSNLINKINSMSGTTNASGGISNSDNKPQQAVGSDVKQPSPQQRPPQQPVAHSAHANSTNSTGGNAPRPVPHVDAPSSASNAVYTSTSSNSNISANIVPGELANKAPAAVSVVTNTKQPPRNVRDWLIMIGYDRYITHFMERGIDTLGKASHVNDQTLIKMGITLKRHRLDLLESIQALRTRLIAESHEQAKKQKEAEQTINNNSTSNTKTNSIEEQQEIKPKVARQIIEDDHKPSNSSNTNANEVSNTSVVNEEKVQTTIQDPVVEEPANETNTNQVEEKNDNEEEPSERVLSRDEKMMLIREEEAKKALEKYEREKAKRELDKQKQAAEENKIKKQNEEKDLLRLKKRRDQIESSNDTSVSSSKNSNISTNVKQKNTNMEKPNKEKSNNNSTNNSTNTNNSSNSSGNNNNNVKKAILAVHGDGPTTWLWCEYGDEGLNLVGSGEGGCDSFGSEIDSNKVLYGLLCVDDGGRDQFVFVLFIGSKVNFQAKANANKRKSEVAELFKPFDVQIKAEDSSDLSYDKIMTTLRASR